MKKLVALSSCLFIMGIVSVFSASPAASSSVQRGAIKIRDARMLSQGAKAWFLGPQTKPAAGRNAPASVAFGNNVDAADPNEDLAAGQSETAIAADGTRVLAAWNDATGFLVANPTTRKGSLTGVGFSNDGAHSFADLVGLPNNRSGQRWNGDPTVVAIDHSHFIVGSLYLPNSFDCTQKLELAVSVATVSATGTVSFTNPIVAANGGGQCGEASSFLDKPFLAYDSVSRTLALAYTQFAPFNPPATCGAGQIDLTRAHVPATPSTLKSTDFSAPIVVEPEENFGSDCNVSFSLEGSYPAVAPGGNTYVAYEVNWTTNLFDGTPYVYIEAALVPANSNVATVEVRPSRGQAHSVNGGVKSLDATLIPGYSRGIGNDFPRIAFNRASNSVDVVWNDASQHPLGDIYLKQLNAQLSNNSTVTTKKVNDDNSYALHFLPAVSVRSNGTICTSWYDRRLHGSTSSLTDYFGECRASAGTSATDFRITSGSTDWANTGSLIDPNFGDYTDNTSTGTTTYYLWSDGRVGVPNPFAASR